MADGVFGVEVVTPEAVLLSRAATAGGPGAPREGDLTVLDGHTPLVGDVVPCERQASSSPTGRPMRFAVHGGFVQVDTSPGRPTGWSRATGRCPGCSTRVTVLAGIAELAEEIDVARAEPARDRATQRAERTSAVGAASDESRRRSSVQEAEGSLARAELAARWPPARRSRRSSDPAVTASSR